MSSKLASCAVALAALFVQQAQATVLFNWVQTGTPSEYGNRYEPFSLAVADSTFLAAQSAPVTFGKISVGIGNYAGNLLNIAIGSADISAQVQVASFIPGQAGLYEISEGLAICNAPDSAVNFCRARYSSSVAQPGGWFTSAMGWGNSYEPNTRYSFTLSGDKLAVDAHVGNFNNVSMRTGADGTGMFSWGSDGVEVVKGYGYFQLDANTIPSAVPLPPTALLMGLGLLGVLARSRRSRS